MKRRIANLIVRFLAPSIIELLVADLRRRGPLFVAIGKTSSDSSIDLRVAVKSAISRDLATNGPLTQILSQAKKSNPPL